jgi:hypothetical protein
LLDGLFSETKATEKLHLLKGDQLFYQTNPQYVLHVFSANGNVETIASQQHWRIPV